jgi:hypothetical protein
MQYLHFVDPMVHVGKSTAGWTPTFKVDPILNAVKKAATSLWDLGRDRTVDESGIGYKGRGISWTQ